MKVRRFALLLALVCLLMPTTVLAQSETSFDQVRVVLWPEYDHQAVLVDFYIALSPDTPLPANIVLRLPASAEKPLKIAFQGWDGMLYSLNTTTTQSGDWQQVSFFTPYPELRIEYYDPNILHSGDKRSYEFDWPVDYAVKSLSVVVQQPASASQIAITPNLGGSHKNPDGTVYYAGSFGSLEAGSLFSMQVDYVASSTVSTSTTLLSVSPTQPIQLDSIFNRWASYQILPYLVGNGEGIVLGLGLLVGIALPVVSVLLASGIWQPDLKTWRKRVRLPLSRTRGDEKKVSSQAEIYCYQCGKKAQPGDIYCRSCGAKYKFS
jgi:hypothetical protein